MRLILSESQIANILKKKYNFDLDGKVKKITKFEQLPEKVGMLLGKGPFTQYLNVNLKSSGEITPFYLIDFGRDTEKEENKFLYHEGPPNELVKIDNRRLNLYNEKKFREEFDIPNIGFSLTEIFDLFT